MSRQLRLLGLALLAIVATSAVGASGAQAGFFTPAAFPATITGAAIGSHELTTNIGTMECAPTFHSKVMEVSSEMTVAPTYGTSCSIAGKEVHVSNNGCDFLMHAGNTLGEDAVAGSMDIVCPQGNAIDFEITSNPVCHLTVPGQAGLNALTYTNQTGAAKDVKVDFSLGEIVYGLDNGCPGPGIYANGSYGGVSTLKAEVEGMGIQFGVG
ncbi:MAG: hypothetical protein M3335_05935 [Actinomycetota bacterium]|nr:hypothetical protein [Actinomycetota bacterium]